MVVFLFVGWFVSRIKQKTTEQISFRLRWRIHLSPDNIINLKYDICHFYFRSCCWTWCGPMSSSECVLCPVLLPLRPPDTKPPLLWMKRDDGALLITVGNLGRDQKKWWNLRPLYCVQRSETSSSINVSSEQLFVFLGVDPLRHPLSSGCPADTELASVFSARGQRSQKGFSHNNCQWVMKTLKRQKYCKNLPLFLFFSVLSVHPWLPSLQALLSPSSRLRLRCYSLHLVAWIPSLPLWEGVTFSAFLPVILLLSQPVIHSSSHRPLWLNYTRMQPQRMKSDNLISHFQIQMTAKKPFNLLYLTQTQTQPTLA